MLRVQLILFFTLIPAYYGNYWKEREDFIALEKSMEVGGSINFSNQEIFANKILMKNKLKEHDEGFEDPSKFLAAQHFFEAREEIEKSEVFKIIRKMPKGSLLHSHDTAMASQEYVYNLTFWDNLYGCKDVNGNLRLKFFKEPDSECDWMLMSEMRKEPDFEQWLKHQLTLIVDDPRSVYDNINVVWNKFNNIFGTVTDMLTYRPVFEDYFRQTLEEHYEDNVMYIEFRGTLPTLYDLDGRTYGPNEIAGIYVKVIEDFKKTHKDFFDCKFIYAPVRKVDNATFESYLEVLTDLKNNYPNFIAGFDLVGQEDIGRPLIDFVENLQKLKIDFYFHAGETNWYGASTDLNLVDAVLLGTKRIGHGFALAKHPQVLKIIKEKSIAIEISPISNQVLNLVADMRNHPGSMYIANNFSIVISNDDPSFWGAKGLSYDFYMAFMGFASRNSDLKLLKQLAINSIIHTALDDEQRSLAFKLWERKWNDFLEQLIAENNSNILKLT